jgi:catechol 2,3-dioxygenase-like lactoylglutathione lyase family enzyme
MAGSSQAWRWHHTGVAVNDLPGAIDFYRTTLGFQVEFEVHDLTDLIQQLTGVPGLRVDLAQLRAPLSDHVLELLRFSDIPDTIDPVLPVRAGMAHAAYLVEDLDASVAALERAGGSPYGQITTFAEGRGVYCRTPVDTVVELLEQPRDPAHDQGAAMNRTADAGATR